MAERFRVVLLDDEKDILELLNRFLTRKTLVDVMIFSNPLEAIECIKTNDIDLLLTDIMMPEMNGIDVLKEVKLSKPNTKVIMMTAYSTMDKILECEKLGASDYITKPFISLKDIENKILNTLGLEYV